VCDQSIWVGDKQGKLHVLDNTLTEVKVIEKHTKAVTALSSNGKIVASGDAYRYIFVFDGQTHEELFNCGDHKDKILDLHVGNDDTILSVTHDNAYGVISITGKKMVTQVKAPHGAKAVTNVLLKENTHVITMGADCALRQWALP
jgi:WD40 repeat protein